MYFVPVPMWCNKCGYSGDHSKHATPAPITAKGLICPACYEQMLEQMCGILQINTVDHPAQTESAPN